MPNIDSFDTVHQTPQLSPDYEDVVFPPNIAPLNFIIKEQADLYYVEISSSIGPKIKITTEDSMIIIPKKQWRTLLEANKGSELLVDIYTKNKNTWQKFNTVKNKIANDPIDQYIVYRKMRPTHYRMLGKVGVYQRDLTSYCETPVLEGTSFHNGCVNCHTFCNNETKNVLISYRSQYFGDKALLIKDGHAQKIGTKFTYTSWHPSGKLLVFSVNEVRQFFYETGYEIRDAFDRDSMLAYYLVDKDTVKTCPQISSKDRQETYPTWSPDGKYLYFSSAPMLWANTEQAVPPNKFDQLKYDLVRISYDIETDTWGQVETIIKGEDIGKTVLLPRISPDGRWALVCMADYGCFPAFRPASDLYIVDLVADSNGQYKYRKLDINSDTSESYHSFSSDGKWIVFSSKRRDSVYTRPYISSFEPDTGIAHKPFLLPQKDPGYFDRT
ncbi:MAG TPA: hypothetical protein PLP05_02790, partial [Sedimentisphaerales bacterium]|nr:hypothetical protein [Sedimentisphaerales bacterium]